MNNCKICHSENTKKIKIGDHNFIKCSLCDIHYLDNIPTVADIENYYQKGYKITSADIIETEKRRIFRIPEQVEIISIIKDLFPPPAKILDIGCDKGFFIDDARRYGYSVEGVEPSIVAKEYCNNIGINIFPNIDSINGKYDIVCLFHSLEHQINPVEHLQKVSNILNDNGLILIRVPAFDCFWRKLLNKKWIWLQPQNHYFHFSIKSLEYILNSTGYKIKIIKHKKPNNRHTKTMNSLSNKVFNKNFNRTITLKEKLRRYYEDLTGIEIFIVATKNNYHL